MASAVLGSLTRRAAVILIAIPILAVPLVLATGFIVSYSPSPVPTWTAGFPLSWETTTLVPCVSPFLSGPASLTTTPLIISPCFASFESSINWFYLATDALIYTVLGYALVPIFRRPMKTGSVVLLAGILATIITSIPVFHEVGTGYPTVYDKHGFPFPWLTYVTGGIVCGPGLNCPVGPRPMFNWAFLVFDTILYMAIASATLTIFRTGLLGQPQLFSGIGPKKTGQSELLRTELVAGSPS